MARKPKKGLSYFPMDIDIFQDIKIRKLIKYQGGKAISVYAYLLCSIYKDGYYMRWDNELPFVVSEVTGYDEAYIHEVIKSCLNIGLFSKELFEKEKILTSKGIQERFVLVMKSLNRVSEISEFNLISSEETPISSQEMLITSPKTPVSSEFGTQRKEKERKEKEITSEDKSSCHLDGDEPTSDPRISYTEFIEGFNKICTRLPKVQMITEKRRGFINARLKEHGRERIFEMFQKANLSDFLAGQNGEWMADFDWLMRPNNFVKVLEGKYNNKTNGTSTLKASDPRRSAAEGYNVPL